LLNTGRLGISEITKISKDPLLPNLS